ncbi:MAG: hypothetical protein KJS64_07575, partial [Acidobacteria bacterium]|nr:hypothetical protein [Acidobacteriota bacterium]
YYGFWGVNWNALSALIVGMSLAVAAYAKPFGAVGFPPKWMSPITGAFGWYDEGSMFGGLADFSIPLGFVAAALVYYVLDRDAGYIAHQESGRPQHIVTTRTPYIATGLASLWTLVTTLVAPSTTSSLVVLAVGVTVTGVVARAGRQTNAGRDVISTVGIVTLCVTGALVSYHRTGTWWIAPLLLAVMMLISRWCVPSTKTRPSTANATD